MKITEQKYGDIAFRMWSGGTGAPLLYLHGFEQHPGASGFLTRLCENFEVKAPELPGYGGGAGLDTLRDVLDVSLLQRRLIEDWGRGPVDVIGHSLGGMFAAELAAIAPHLVRRLVLVDAYGLWRDDAPLPDPFVMMPDALARAKWHDPARAGGEPSAFDPARDGSAATFRSVNLAAATKFLWPIPDRGLRRRTPYIQSPTLVVHGASDGLIPPAYGEALADLIPGARFKLLEKAGHLPMVEAEDAFLAHVRDFLS